MTDATSLKSLVAAVENYFETMFDSNVDRFDRVFAPTAQLHGLRDGNLRVLQSPNTETFWPRTRRQNRRMLQDSRRSCSSTSLRPSRRSLRSGFESI